MNKTNKTALITGASSGLGMELKAGFDGMMQGKMTVTGGLTFMQKIFTNMTHFIPKKLLMKQIYEMQQLKK